MTHLVFFEKPGCGGNTRQRAALEAAGHTLERHNLLTAPWTPETLMAFLAPLPVPDWFNRAAPRVKTGEVQPDTLDAEGALARIFHDSCQKWHMKYLETIVMLMNLTHISGVSCHDKTYPRD